MSDLAAYIKSSHRWIMVTNLCSVRWPCVDMNVFILRTAFRHCIRHKHVVQLLRIHVEQIRIALYRFDLGYRIQVLETRYLDVFLQRLDEAELVEVTCSDDTSVPVFG